MSEKERDKQKDEKIVFDDSSEKILDGYEYLIKDKNNTESNKHKDT